MILEFIAKMIEKFNDSHWEIVSVVSQDHLTGRRQEDSTFGHVYVDQSGPGMLGDDYRGHLYIPVENAYVKVWYCS